jgi:hypothetical protein
MFDPHPTKAPPIKTAHPAETSSEKARIINPT